MPCSKAVYNYLHCGKLTGKFSRTTSVVEMHVGKHHV